MTEIELKDVKAGEYPDKPVCVTEANFEEFKKRFPVSLIDFWAPWCGPCMRLTPIIEELARDMKGKVVFGKINVDDNQAIAKTFGVHAIPAMFIFKKGEVVDQVFGLLPKGKLLLKLKEHL